ncbi:uncharacterized protein LOC101845745 [Aplysia californica]|uniref:Uncharacterized protein LOC101845745 n=1 Tax=Aplysia californica TaxID=6500 RepID=A0ABM0KAD2_APLCA|nr:uncharacterized protein LOC101845745 [Aplysia californica]
MDTTTEITVIVEGHHRSQAFFVEDRYWDVPLHEIRDILAAHELDLPPQYKFITNSKNLIATPAEQSVTLKKLMTDAQPSDESTDSHQKTETRTIHIAPLLSKTRKCGKGTDFPGYTTFKSEDGASFQFCEEADQQDRGSETSQPNENEESPSYGSPRCPMHSFRHVFMNLHDKLDWKMLIKVLMFFMFLLTCLLFLLTVMVHLLTSIVNPQELLAPWTSHGLRDSQDLSNLKLKMSELEISTRFELQDLRKRLTDLEDMYLRDLKLVSEDSKVLKNQQSQMEASVKSAMVDISLRLDHLTGQDFQGRKGRDVKPSRDDEFTAALDNMEEESIGKEENERQEDHGKEKYKKLKKKNKKNKAGQ